MTLNPGRGTRSASFNRRLNGGSPGGTIGVLDYIWDYVMRKIQFVSMLVMCLSFIPISGSADPAEATVEVECGGSFQPQVDAIEGVSRETLFRLVGSSGRPRLIPTDPAFLQNSQAVQTFCSTTDGALKARCEAAALQDAINDAVAECRRAAIAKGSDANLYKCKRESCPQGSPGCEIHATNTDCQVLIPKLQCRCGVQPFFEQPFSQISTYACGCNCKCTASGTADMQCTNCDGSCVQTSGASTAGGEDSPTEDPLMSISRMR